MRVRLITRIQKSLNNSTVIYQIKILFSFLPDPEERDGVDVSLLQAFVCSRLFYCGQEDGVKNIVICTRVQRLA